METEERRNILRLFNSYNLHPDYPWYRKVAAETKPGKKLSAESCAEIQRRGGPSAVSLRPDIFSPSKKMCDLINIMRCENHTAIDVYGGVIRLIKEDYPSVAEEIPACRQETSQ